MKRLSVFLMAVLIAVFSSVSVMAEASSVEVNKKGSLSVTMKCPHDYICGGNVALYHIADLVMIGEDYKFEYTDEFKDCPVSLDNISEENSPQEYNKYIIEKQIVVSRSILDEGTVVYNDIPLGLYLVVHEEPSEGFSAALPFLVTVPVSKGDGWEYNVDATPKVEIEHHEVSAPSNIPQTGQLKWPIPVMIASGIIIFAIGLVLCLKRSRY